VETQGIVSSSILRVSSLDRARSEDRLAVEEPLELRLGERGISITMRTPGNDPELAAGFLFTEGIVARAEDLAGIRHCGTSGNVVRVDLRPEISVDLKRLERHFYTSSSCGVCGKSSIEALTRALAQVSPGLRVSSRVLRHLPETLRRSQQLFDRTGGMHASALFAADGELKLVREDVGRHNALDKVIGHEFLADRLPLRDRILLVSGRASFELVQKAAASGITIFAAVGAPSSLAAELARETGMTLIGFLRDDRFNVYCGEERVLA
jgi:FdhD protein